MKINLSFLTFFVFINMAPVKGVAEESNWEPYPKHIHHCLEAMNNHMGKEKEYIELMSVKDLGNSDCKISAMFKNQENIEKFNKARIKQGKDPNFVKYETYNIQIVKSIGETIPH